MVAVLLADGFEEIEALTPVDVLRRGAVKVVTSSVNGDLCVCGGHNIMVDADDIIENIDYDELEAVILPGGSQGTENLEKCSAIEEILEHAHKNDKLMCAICAAPKILGKYKYLDGKKATCFPGYESDLYGARTSKDDVVVDGNVITSRGMGTAMDFSLAILERLKGKKAANMIAVSVIYK